MLFIQDRQLKMRRAGAGIVLNGMRESLDRALEIRPRTRLLPTMKYGSFCSSCGLGPGGQHPVPNKAKKARHRERAAPRKIHGANVCETNERVQQRVAYKARVTGQHAARWRWR